MKILDCMISGGQETMSDELAELRKISRILTLVNAKVVEDKLSEYATTDNRKKIWTLIDGKRMPNNIAQSIRISTRSVERFLKILETAELIENLRGKPPKRLLDYVPPSWLELVKVEVSGEEEEQKSEEAD